MKAITGKDKIFFGKDVDGQNIYLTKPSWDCGWYWGFGYLGNSKCHYHLSGYKNGRNINMHDALLQDYELNPVIKDNLWQFCEQVLTIYALKEMAKVLGRGGSHMITNKHKDFIQDKDYADKINEKLQFLLQSFWDDFSIDKA